MQSHESRVHSSVEELDEANRKAGWQVEYRQLRPGPFRARFDVQEARNLVATREMLPAGIEIRGGIPKGTLSAIFVDGKDGRLRLNGEKASQGRLFVALPDSDFDATVGGTTVGLTVSVPTEVFSDAATRLGHHSLGDLSGRVLSVPVGPGALGALSPVAWLQNPGGGSAGDHADLDPGQSVATTLVELLAGTPGASGQPPSHRPDAECLHRARRFVEVNYRRPLRLEHICAHVGTGARTLQRVFRRDLGVSPIQYVLASRLRAVRHELFDLVPERGRVTSVALKHGFRHLGRFSSDYRSFFGEAPSETLGRIAVGSEA